MENKKTERILVINPGSTSTKIAVFDDDKQIMAQTIRHPLDEVKAFSWVMDQFDYRMEHINAALETAGIDKSTLTCVILPPSEVRCTEEEVSCRMYSSHKTPRE